MGSPSSPIAGLAVAGCRFRFQFALAVCRRSQAKRRLAVAEYLDGWVPLRVVAEHIDGRRCWVWVELARRVSADAARDYVRGCPGYAPGSFKMLA